MGTKEQRQSGPSGSTGPRHDGPGFALVSGRELGSLVDEELAADGFTQMRHEIRTLLSGIIGISGLLLESELDAEQRDYARRIRNGGEAVLSMVSDMVDFGQLGATELHLEPVDFDLRRAVEEVGELLGERAHDDGTELVVEVHPDVPGMVRGDAARLRRVLLNVIVQAIRAVPRGEVVIRAACAGPDSALGAAAVAVAPGWTNTRVRFELQCTSYGVPAEDAADSPAGGVAHRPRLVSQTSLRTGLYVEFASRLVGAMGGELIPGSDAGRGHSLSFVLPFDRRERSSGRDLIPRTDLTGQRALVIDDSAAARRALQGMIEEVGVTCGTAASGEAALSALRSAADSRQPYEVIFVDLEMADIDGVSLVRRIKADPSLARARVVMMSYLGRESRGRTEVDAVLAKPIRRTQLHASLRAFTSQPSEHLTAAEHAYVPRRRRTAPPVEATRVRPRILVVEDNATNQKVAAFMVEKRGYKVDVVEGGHAAVEAVRRSSYAAVLMDCQMPIFDGYAATVEIRKAERAPDRAGHPRRTPIIAMTAYVGPGEREKCLAAGMDDYLSKPLTQDELDRVLRTWGAAGRSGPHETAAPDGGRQNVDAEPIPARGSSPPIGGRASALVEPGGRAGASQPRLRAGETDVVAELIELFVTEAPARIAEMRRAAARGVLGEIERLAWALHESADRLGALNLKDLCARLDREARAGTAQRAMDAVQAIEREVERVQGSLVGELKKRGLG